MATISTAKAELKKEESSRQPLHSADAWDVQDRHMERPRHLCQQGRALAVPPRSRYECIAGLRGIIEAWESRGLPRILPVQS